MPDIMNNKSSCVGCTACKAACPKDCITMKMDSEGFLFPNIDFRECISCGKCDAVCPINNIQMGEFDKHAYYGWNNNVEIRYNSSSGGAFASLANNILSGGGVVFGAVFDAVTKSVFHKSTDSIELKRLQKSKYVESGLLNTFTEVKEHLSNERKVLFCGTPCQIAGLSSFIGENNNLLTCDFVCHGIPSGGLFKEHLEYIEHLYKGSIIDVDFRSKSVGWSGKYTSIKITAATSIITPYLYDSFYKGFLADSMTLRRSCYDCRFADNHVSDITLADFWGYRKFNPALNDEKGISLIIANSPKGDAAIKNIASEFDLRPLDMEYASYVFERKNYSDLIIKRDNFFKLASKIGFEKAADKTYFRNNGYKYAKYKVKQKIKKLLKYQS